MTGLALTLALALAPGDLGADLLKLVPPDAGVTLAAVDLRGQLEAIAASPLAKGFAALPAVRAWPDSPAGLRFALARARIETSLGAKLPAIRDGLLGDAVVLSLHLPPGAPPEAARGLLLARVRDRAMMSRLIDLVNKAESKNLLVEVAQRGTKERPYTVRRFKPGAVEVRETEYYRLFDDGTFAWSNSEPLLKGVLDRKGGDGPGLADDPGFRKVRLGLPSRPLLFVHVSPRFVDRVIAAAPRSGDPGGDRAAEIIARYLRAVDGIGLALEWRDGLLLHSHEAFDPEAIDPRLRRWANSGASPDALARRIPRTAIASTAATIDFAGACDVLADLIPGDDRASLDAVLLLLQGVLLGRDVRKEILPRIGPALIAYVEAPPADSSRFPLVGVLELRDERGEPTVAAALDNALRFLLSLSILDPNRPAVPLRVESHQAGPLRVTSLGGPASPFAYGIGRDCLVVGTSADAVSRFGTSEPDTRLAPFKARYFPDARLFAAVDMVRLSDAAKLHREPLAKRFASSRGDLDQAVALLDLFDAAFFAVTVDPALASVHQTIGLIAR